MHVSVFSSLKVLTHEPFLKPIVYERLYGPNIAGRNRSKLTALNSEHFCEESSETDSVEFRTFLGGIVKNKNKKLSELALNSERFCEESSETNSLEI